MTQRIYCGPNILKFGLVKYQVFIGEDYAFNVKDAMSVIPEIEKMFCQIEELEDFRRALRDSGSPQSVYYREIEKKIKEVNK